MPTQIVTHLGQDFPWVADKTGHNQFTVTFTNASVAYDISLITFSVNIRKIGASTNALQLTQGSGVTNGGTTGILTITLSAANIAASLPSSEYFYEIAYTIGGLGYKFLEGTLTLSAQGNPGTTTTSLSITSVNLAGTNVNAVVNLVGSGGSGSMTGAEIITALGYTPADDADLDTVASAASAHIGNTSNPHSVTKGQVGLGNVDNTSDVNKPVSTAQQAAINAKVADEINNGTTTIAPSQNAVFDALATKQDLIPGGSAGQVWTSNGPGFDPTFQSLSGDLSEYGEVFNEDFSGTLDDFTKSLSGGVTMNIVSNRLEVSAGTSNSNTTNRMHYNVWGPTNMESFTLTADVVAGTIDANNLGLGFDQTTIAAFGTAVHNNFKIDLSSGSNLGKITLNCLVSTTLVYTKTSDVGLTINTGDVLKVRWRFANNRHFFEVVNTNTGETNSLEYVITLTFQSDMGPSGNYSWAVHGYGGINYVDNWRVESHEPVGADFMYVGDSKTKGNGSDHLLNRWSNKIKDRCDVDVIVSASAGASLYSINVNDILAFAPQKIVLDIGVNDLTGGNAATLFTDYQTLVNSLVSNGYVVGTSLFFHLLTPYQPKASDIAAFNALIKAAYPTAYIDLYTATLSGSSYNTKYSLDGIHPSVEGQNFIANTHINYFRLPLRTNRTASFNQVLYNEGNGYVTIGDIYNKTRTPKNILDLQQNGTADIAASIHVNGSTGTSAASREEGAYLSHVDSFGATIVSSNAKPTGATTFTAKNTFGSAYKQFNGAHFFQTFSGATTGNSVTPTQQGRWNPTGLIIGAGSAAAGMLDIQQGVLTSAWIPAIVVNGGAHTGETASTEFLDADFKFNRTVQHATGALSLQRSAYFRGPTYSFVGASTLTRAVTVAISGPPIASTNNTTTNAIGLEVESAAVGAGTGTGYAAFFNAPTGATTNRAVGTVGDVVLTTAGNGLYVKEGSNATMGTATLSSGTITVNTTKVTANSRIFLTINGGTLTNVGTPYVSARSAGTSFTITSTNASDASNVAWIIIEPAP